MTEIIAFISENAGRLFAVWLLVALFLGMLIGRAIKFGRGDWTPADEVRDMREQIEWLEARR